mgnify:CR=1 FL=1
MESRGIISIIVVTIAVFAVVFGIGMLVRKASPEVVKYINWAVFGLAIISGLASYSLEGEIYRYIFFASLIAYFLTIGYKPGQK